LNPERLSDTELTHPQLNSTPNHLIDELELVGPSCMI
jgi:hypothetical protein